MSTAVSEAGWEFPHILDAQPLDDGDAELVKDLVAVLEKHNALERFGLSLLHQHFPISEDEVLCETVDTENRVLMTRPVKKSAVEAEPHTVTLWDLRSKEPIMACICQNIGGSGHLHWPIVK